MGQSVPPAHLPGAASHRITELPGGLRVATEAMPAVRSVALGYWIDTGSRDERHEQAGLSHLLEHLLFRGTANFTSLEVDQIFDEMGAELNAGTGKETTSVYSRVLDIHLERAVEVMSDMVWRPAIDDIDPERQVILEEIAMYEDDPQDKVFDLLGEATFGDDPLGRSVIGRAEVVRDTPPEAIRTFHQERYRPGEVVIAATGSVDHDALVELVARHAPEPGRHAPAAGPGAVPAVRRARWEVKETEQFHFCLGGPGVARDDPRRFALRVLDAILGATGSSRLFQEVRERRGLAYSVFSFLAHHEGAGQVGIYVGTRPDNLSEALAIVTAELERLQESPVSGAELARAKEHVKGRTVLALESTSARMSRLGASLLTGVPLYSLDELIELIDAITVEDLTALARELWRPAALSVACIGPDERRLRAAMEAAEPLADLAGAPVVG